ncbi:MAG: phosphatase PAP2 family protein [Actinobacteria bacterium]|nr:phosphatase PAP2 family protein [Actinomycetota bacterium]
MPTLRRTIHLLDELGLQVGRSPSGPWRAVAGVASRSVRGGTGWAACSAVLAVTGGRRARRAAVDGLSAWALADAGAFATKRLVHRRRPHARAVAGHRTRSSSMPSSHTAGAVAYAVAAGWALPPLAPAVLAAAAVVAWSRVSTGHHFPTDVVAGAALGATAGATVVLVRRRLAPASGGSSATAGPGAAGVLDAEAAGKPTTAGTGAAPAVTAGAAPRW